MTYSTYAHSMCIRRYSEVRFMTKIIAFKRCIYFREHHSFYLILGGGVPLRNGTIRISCTAQRHEMPRGNPRVDIKAKMACAAVVIPC